MIHSCNQRLRFSSELVENSSVRIPRIQIRSIDLFINFYSFCYCICCSDFFLCSPVEIFIGDLMAGCRGRVGYSRLVGLLFVATAVQGQSLGPGLMIGPVNPSQVPTSSVSSLTASSFSSAVTPAYCAELARQTGCDSLPGECLDCMFNCTCVYGTPVTVECAPKKNIDCRHEVTFRKRTMMCRYCYQSPPEEHICEHNSSCQVDTRRCSAI